MSRFFIVPRNLAIAFYAAWETGSKIEMLGGMEPFIVRELPDGLDRMIRVALKDQRERIAAGPDPGV